MADGLKQRENLYKLMISQLRYDGFDAIANNLAKVVNIISACPPMARLYEVVNLGIQAETEGTRPEPTVLPGLTPSVETSRGVDLEYEPEGKEVNGEWQNSTTDESFMSNLELQKVDQDCEKVFAKAVLGKSQGYLSEMLKHGENFFRPQDNTHYKGWMNFEIMRQFLQRPEAERLRIYYQKGEELKRERMKRRQIEIGLSDDALRKRRHYIRTEAKAVMEDHYLRSKYLSLEKRQTLAIQLPIPEQCVSDYFKNLRSKKKHEERMKCLLKGLEHGQKQPDQGDSGDEDEDSVENGSSENPGLCLPENSAVLTSSAAGEASPQSHGHAQSLSLIHSCGRRFNVSPSVSASSPTFPTSSERKVSETDLVASKIAALRQSQKSLNKESGVACHLL
ncbi:Cleavage stimulation factor subunit 1 [Stylophora pistillata]|uniref:One cut domain family member n=1 Tax=Stylophora pistillata TaxID=50429 RepID=A0A2B4S7V0_STYPI|nr:Cleavage stimulation factor subunit 1 [Stylophora pistillata]